MEDNRCYDPLLLTDVNFQSVIKSVQFSFPISPMDDDLNELDKRSFWHDSSLKHFFDVFDEDYFINVLSNDVKIITKVPKELAAATRAVKRFRSWSESITIRMRYC